LHAYSAGDTEIRSESTGNNALFSVKNSGGVPWILTQRNDTSNAFSLRYSGNNYFNVTTTGNVGIGTTSPASTVGGLDVASGGISLVLGADNNANTRTNSTAKVSRLAAYHYTNNEEPFGLVVGNASATTNALTLGGGSSALNAATEIRFYTAANNTTTTGTERARIDSSGRLLVGTSSSSLSTGIQVQGYAGGSAGQGILTLSRGSALPIASTVIGDIRFYDNGSGFGAKLEATTDGPWASGDYPTRLVFSTTADGASGPTERMRIGSNGFVDIGSGGVGSNLRAMIKSGSKMQISNTSTATTNLAFIEFGRSATLPGSYTAEGTIGTDGSGNLAFANASDITLKENVRDLDNCLETVSSLRPVLFDWKEDYKPCCADVKGFIAQEFEQVLPKSVSTDDNGIKSISPVTELLPLLVGALKEANAKIEALEAKVAALEAQ